MTPDIRQHARSARPAAAPTRWGRMALQKDSHTRDISLVFVFLCSVCNSARSLLPLLGLSAIAFTASVEESQASAIFDQWEGMSSDGIEPPDPHGLDWNRLLPLFMVGTLALGGVLRSALGRVRGATTAALVVGVLAWFLSKALAIAAMGALVAFAFTLIGVRAGGLFGLGGGNRDGGGGGRFGGGGASGRW